MPIYSQRRLLELLDRLGSDLSTEDWRGIALAALDQAGCSLHDQDSIAKRLGWEPLPSFRGIPK
jgi:hypothetical protein